MRVRSVSWIVVVVGTILLLISPLLDLRWEQVTDAISAAAVMAVGLGLVIFARPSHG